MINDNLQQLIRTIYDYWFTQFDFPDGNGNPYRSSGGKIVFNESLNRDIPASWNVYRLGDCITHINTGLNPRDNFALNEGGNIKYITVKNLTTSGSLDFSSCDYITEEVKQLINKRSQISKRDILFASIAPLGRCYLICDAPKAWEINESVFPIRANNNLVSPEYLYLFLMSEEFIKRAENSSTGSVFSGIRVAVLEDMPIIVPPKEILNDFEKAISQLFLLRQRMEQENQCLIEVRDWLLPMLMNGQAAITD